MFITLTTVRNSCLNIPKCVVQKCEKQLFFQSIVLCVAPPVRNPKWSLTFEAPTLRKRVRRVRRASKFSAIRSCFGESKFNNLFKSWSFKPFSLRSIFLFHISNSTSIKYYTKFGFEPQISDVQNNEYATITAQTHLI